MARTTTGIDIGLRSAQLMRGYYKGNTFHVSDFSVASYAEDSVTGGWQHVDPGFKPSAARVGLTGREVNVRYSRVPRVPDWQLKNLMRFEVEEIGDQSGVGVASDFNLLPEIPEVEGEDIVLLAMARENLLEEHYSGLERVGGKLDAFTPNAIALYNAWLRFGVLQDDTVLVANIGHDNIDVVISRGPDLLFARNLSGGSRLFSDAIAQRFNVSQKKAEEVKINQATLAAGSYRDAMQEKASRAIMGAAGQLLSLLQSAILFCKSQVKITGLKVDRVMLCGGGAALDGLCDYLSSGMSVPVELFDPFTVVDVDALDEEAQDQLNEYRLESVVALGLATMGSDPEAYSLEILPRKMLDQREFWGKKAFLIGTAVLALAYLGFDTWRTRSELGVATTEARKLSRDVNRAKSTHKKTADLIEENEQLAELAFLLQGVTGNGEQLARLLEVLDEELQEDFWITELECGWQAEPSLGVERGTERPIMRIKGRARQGTVSLSTQFETFVASLSKLPGVQLEPKLSPQGTEFTVDLTTLVPVVPDPNDEADGEAGEMNEEEG